jgi:hypothetical protein
MARRSRTNDPELLRVELEQRIANIADALRTGPLRAQVLALVDVAHSLRDLGGSLMKTNGKSSGKDRVLAYLRAHIGIVVAGTELMVVSGIGEYPRRIRELRKEDGWPILSGVTAREMIKASEEEDADPTAAPPPMKPDDYMLLADERDELAAGRWKIANSIRRKKTSVQAKVLEYLRANVGRPVTGEELRYVAVKNEWPRRTRELRTELGWPVVTRFSGDPSLPVGIYILAEDKQGPEHDRHIKEITRRKVMERDHWSCQWRDCGWSHERIAYDRRFLEVHHVEMHVEGGSNEVENLVTLCNLHHDEFHRTDVLDLNDQAAALLSIPSNKDLTV